MALRTSCLPNPTPTNLLSFLSTYCTVYIVTCKTVLSLADLPRDCQEAKEKLALKKNDVILIDIDGPDGDDEGNLEPFYVHCDVESYHGVAVTQIPHNSKLVEY